MTTAGRETAEGHLVGTVRDVFADAVTSYEHGNFARAEEILRQVVDAEPRLAAAWHMRGLIARRNEDTVRASEYFAAAVSRAPTSSTYSRDLGISLLARDLKREALETLERAIALDPEDAAAQFYLGNALLLSGRPFEATHHLNLTLQLEPDSAAAHCSLAAAYRACGRPQEAVAAANAALALSPRYTEALNNLALANCDLGHYPEAIKALRTASTSDPEDESLLNNLGVALHANGQREEAERVLKSALELKPGWGEASLNLGNLLRQKGHFDEAVAYYRQALTDNPLDVKPYGNLGLALINLNRPEEAASIYEKALGLDPGNADIRMSLGIAQLMQGNYAEGWENYEARWEAPSFTAVKRTFDIPRWDGTPVAGKRIIVHAEQGFGDTLQFCRYLPLLAREEMTVVFECQKALARLCASIEGIAGLVVRGDALPAADFHIPLLSLPYLFETTVGTIPGRVPYLLPPPSIVDAWQRRIAKERFSVGFVWTGDPSRQDDSMRSCPKSALAPLLAISNVDFYSLQVGDGPDSSMTGVVHLGDRFGDFAETAAAIMALDLVVTVDTAVAHLAGALGRPVWVMLGAHADWRYLMSREDSPWYPTMRLFRQRRHGDWTELVERVASSLLAHRRNSH